MGGGNGGGGGFDFESLSSFSQKSSVNHDSQGHEVKAFEIIE